MKPGFLLSVLFLVASCTTAPAPAVDTEKKDWVVEFPSAASLSSTDFDPIRDVVGSRSIVMLGESMHLTSELSRVRDMLIDGSVKTQIQKLREQLLSAKN